MNWCEEKVGTLIFINDSSVLEKLMNKYKKKECERRGIKIKIYYIDLLHNNPRDFEQMADHVYDLNNIDTQKLPIKNEHGSLIFLDTINYLCGVINDHFSKEFTFNQFIKNGEPINQLYDITVETLVIELIGQLLYNYIKDIDTEETLEPVVALGRHLGFGREKELIQFKLIFFTALQDIISITNDDAKNVFLQTIKEQIRSDTQSDNVIPILYTPKHITDDMVRLNVFNIGN